jgi:hypothetical protein
MSILVRFTPTAMRTEQYDSAVSKMEEAGEFPPEGLDLHVCFGEDGDLKVSEVWDSTEKFEAFGEKLMPVLAEIGIEPGEPQVIPVHNVVKR